MDLASSYISFLSLGTSEAATVDGMFVFQQYKSHQNNDRAERSGFLALTTKQFYKKKQRI